MAIFSIESTKHRNTIIMEKTSKLGQTKSFLIGFFIACTLILLMSAKTYEGQNGRFQATSSERGFLILDTQTGDYILDSEVNYIGKIGWIKGTFETDFEQGRDKSGR